MLSQYLVNISRTSAKLLPQLEEGPSFQTEGPLTKKVKFGSLLIILYYIHLILYIILYHI